MITKDNRSHGVTPGLRQDYVKRTAEHQAAFALPHLRPGMDLLDVGCGPGSITLGLARAVAPGHVIGIDHDKKHIQAARAMAVDNGVDNISFEIGDALNLPFDNCAFEAVYENDLFTHLAQNAVRAAREAYRLLKEGGILAARDVDVQSAVWGNQSEPIKELDRLMIAWQRERGSDVTLGKRLPAILREAGFIHIGKSVSADSKGDPESVQSHTQITLNLLDGPFGKAILDNGWGDKATVERLKGAIRAWGGHPDSFFANVHVEVIGWKETWGKS